MKRLLDGTGLAVFYAEPNAFTLQPQPVRRNALVPTINDFMAYLGAVQGSIEEAFCGHPLTALGAYRIRFSFRIDSTGKVLQAQLLGSTDDAARDQAIAGLLNGLTIDRPPPPDMPQPVVMAIFPRPPAETGDCGAVRQAARRAPAP